MCADRQSFTYLGLLAIGTDATCAADADRAASTHRRMRGTRRRALRFVTGGFVLHSMALQISFGRRLRVVWQSIVLHTVTSPSRLYWPYHGLGCLRTLRSNFSFAFTSAVTHTVGSSHGSQLAVAKTDALGCFLNSST
jgi:hypothetical protein